LSDVTCKIAKYDFSSDFGLVLQQNHGFLFSFLTAKIQTSLTWQANQNFTIRKQVTLIESAK